MHLPLLGCGFVRLGRASLARGCCCDSGGACVVVGAEHGCCSCRRIFWALESLGVRYRGNGNTAQLKPFPPAGLGRLCSSECCAANGSSFGPRWLRCVLTGQCISMHFQQACSKRAGKRAHARYEQHKPPGKMSTGDTKAVQPPSTNADSSGNLVAKPRHMSKDGAACGGVALKRRRAGLETAQARKPATSLPGCRILSKARGAWLQTLIQEAVAFRSRLSTMMFPPESFARA